MLPKCVDAMAGVRPTPSSSGSHAAVCGDNNYRLNPEKMSLPLYVTASFRPNKKQHEWLSSIFCLLEAVICVSHCAVSVINAFDLIWDRGKIQSAFSPLIFHGWRIIAGLFCFFFSSLTHLGQWFMWHLRAQIHTHTHTRWHTYSHFKFTVRR